MHLCKSAESECPRAGLSNSQAVRTSNNYFLDSVSQLDESVNYKKVGQNWTNYCNKTTFLVILCSILQNLKYNFTLCMGLRRHLLMIHIKEIRLFSSSCQSAVKQRT